MSDSDMIPGLSPHASNSMDVDVGVDVDVDVDPSLMGSKSPSFYNMDLDVSPGESSHHAEHGHDTGHGQNTDLSFTGDYGLAHDSTSLEHHGHHHGHDHGHDHGHNNNNNHNNNHNIDHQFTHPDSHSPGMSHSKSADDEDNLFASGEMIPDWDSAVHHHQNIEQADIPNDELAQKDHMSPNKDNSSSELQSDAHVPASTEQSSSLHFEAPAQPGQSQLPQSNNPDHQFQPQQSNQYDAPSGTPDRSPTTVSEKGAHPAAEPQVAEDLSQNFFAQQELSTSGLSSKTSGHNGQDRTPDIVLDAQDESVTSSSRSPQSSKPNSVAKLPEQEVSKENSEETASSEEVSQSEPALSSEEVSNQTKTQTQNHGSENELQGNGTVRSTPPAEPVKLEKVNSSDMDQEREESDDVSHQDSQPVDINADDKTRIRQSHAIVIPSYASWFNMKKIHQIEKDSLPEFFETSHPSKSPVIYADYRNFMINAYRLNPNEYLTLTSCRRTLVGDVGTLMRVHRFLNKWGLINYQVNPQFKPAYALEKAPDGTSVGLPYCGDFHVQYDTPRGLFPFNTYKPLQGNVNVEKLKELMNGEQVDAGTKHSSIEESNHQEERDEGPPTKKQKIETGDWSSKELANLLLGVQQHQNDWYKIAKTVGGNRTPQDCILKFLKLPIEDNYNKLNENDFGILKFAANFPVLTADNPVISNLIFMTNLVDADVVKAASGNASKVIDESLIKKVREVYDGKKQDANKAEGKEETQDGKEEASKQEVDEELAQEFNSKASESPNELLKNASTAVLGSIGARSHLFASYEEREMQKLTNTILNQELTKLDVKMKKVNELEKIYQRERKNLARQQNDIFVDRLALTRSTIGITKKLNEVVRLLKPSEDEGAKPATKDDDLANATRLLSEVQSLLFKPAKQSLKEVSEASVTEAASAEGEANNADLSSGDLSKPVSVVEPQSFKVWAP
ncbi:hypothetical protein JCM33374_g4563 [Metschnikowia sp. JCM 33374]|nr:hypothetical protein JCM33374_g4563 [Metschnikowia sp. JCM 33374]